MIDKDDSGTLDKAEIVDAVKNDKKVIKFLCNCGNQNLQYLLVPSRLDKALAEMDTDRDGHIDATEWRGAARHELRADRAPADDARDERVGARARASTRVRTCIGARFRARFGNFAVSDLRCSFEKCNVPGPASPGKDGESKI